jgi:hypothetical protein
LDRPNFFNFNHATDQQLENYEVIGLGESVYFPQINEYLGIHAFVGGLNASCS